MPSATAFFPDLTPYFKLDGSRTITGPSTLALSAGNAAFDAFTIRGAAGQTGKLLVLETSALADVFTVDASGNLVVTGGLTGGAISGTTINASGLMTAGAGLNVTGNMAATGIVSGASGSFTGAIGSATANVSGLATLGSVSTGQLIATSIGIGVTPVTALDIVAAIGVQFRLRDVATNAATKSGGIQIGHYTNSEEDVSLIYGTSTSTSNLVYIGGGVSALNAATTLVFWTGTNTATLNGTERMRINPAGNLGIGTSDVGTRVDIVAGNGSQLRLANVTTDVMLKNAYIQGRHYTNAEEDTAMLFMASGATTSVLNIGGGSSLLNTATSIVLSTAANNTTVTGTPRVTIDSSGDITLGDGTDFILNATTGTRIGTTTTGKLGFFGQTAIVRPVLATGAGRTVDDVITVLQNLGLVGQT